MKKLLCLLCVFLMIAMTGCGKQEEAKEIPSYQYNCPGITCATEPEDTPANVIDTKYYTLTLPEGWADKCVIELHEDNNGRDMLILWEAESYKTEYGGHLFTIRLVPPNEEYDIFPVYELLATLDTPEGSFYAVALFSDVVQQYSEETAAAYQEVAKDVHNVLYSIRPKGGIEMAMP